MQQQGPNIGTLIIVLVVIVTILGIIYMVLAPDVPQPPKVPKDIPAPVPPPATSPAPASASSTNSEPAPATPAHKARTIGEWKDQTFPHSGTRGKTQEKISDSDCKTRCINEPECVGASYSQWGDCVTWTNLGSDGPTSDCCSGTALIDSDKEFKRTFKEGGSYRCNNGPAGDGAIYRAENNILRHYVTADIAASWDPNWNNFTQIDCAGANFGSPMAKKP